MTALTNRWIVSSNGERWNQCHASTLTQSPLSGVVAVAWFAGEREGAIDNAIWLTRGTPGGNWDEPRIVLRGHERSWWNPVLSYAPDGSLWLFAKNGPKISHWKTWARVSHDDGETWSPEFELVPGDDNGGRGPVKNLPIVTSHGTWVAPNSVESGGDDPVWYCRFDISRDCGKTWKLVDVPLDRSKLRGAGIIQPTVWETQDGLVAVCRSTEGRAFRTTSVDDGDTWSEAVPVELPQNNSGFCAVTLDDAGDRVAIVHNPGSDSWGARCPLVISISEDDGLTWRQSLVVEDGVEPPSVPRGESLPVLHDANAVEGYAAGDTGIITSGLREFSYPTVIREPSGDLLVSYTWQRRGIVVTRIDRADLESDASDPMEKGGSC
ncbi:neuraminidase (sialidase) [Bifidobacterium margollesii]|uniref:Neuraminidase (Sialidase) n=1 Tax=Bifidobacterium margollesii TaxID=2020964 RepID=A0A2N5JAP8_9BIFI|nr:sialidase family protein [Bifidobacterium margollesii]PLS31280.1 neuraminidase (sialidase) [Bifidobacterium margollesii]